jgi:hypothetical protein
MLQYETKLPVPSSKLPFKHDYSSRTSVASVLPSSGSIALHAYEDCSIRGHALSEFLRLTRTVRIKA